MTVFYTLPAALIRPGMSTDDGQDVLDVGDAQDGRVWAQVYTPRPEDPQQDEANRCEPEHRGYDAQQRVSLATFPHTQTDGSHLEQALVTRALFD